jgi:hypothetical protein
MHTRLDPLSAFKFITENYDVDSSQNRSHIGDMGVNLEKQKYPNYRLTESYSTGEFGSDVGNVMGAFNPLQWMFGEYWAFVLLGCVLFFIFMLLK